MADRFDARAEELGTLVTKENGKKIAKACSRGHPPSHAPAQRGSGADRSGISAEIAPGQWFTPTDLSIMS